MVDSGFRPMKKIHQAAAALAVFAAVTLSGCGKIKNPFAKKQPTPTPESAVVQQPPNSPPVAAPPASSEAAAPAPPPATTATTPASPTTPTTPAAAAAPAIDRNAQVVVICYHRLEGRVGGALSIEPELFEKHMQELKDRNIAVISMQDFMAWRAGKKSIPSKSAIITIDDGYMSGSEVGVPILKKYGYPATFFIYTEYVNKGGKSMTWQQLGELRDQGFEIGSHTVSHLDLRRKPAKTTFPDYDSWLKNELDTSKRILEEQLGIRVATIAYPFGLHNAKVQEGVRAAGYELAFTTYGQRIGISAAPFTIGRYDVTSKDAQGHDGFTAAVSFQGPAAASGSIVAQEAQALMVTEPMNNAVVNEQTPRIQANLSSLGALEPSSVIMRIGGLGIVPAKFDPTSKVISYTPTQKLRPGAVTVIISGKAGGQPVETRWSFKVDPNAQSTAEASGADLPPRRQQ
jgi:peptidoglycan/xylan/chitin deacetylase (PgdA/CDA1 family)